MTALRLINENKQFLLLLGAWVTVGVFLGSTAALAVILATVLLLYRGEYLVEILIGFWMILVLSDSYTEQLEFAKSIKPIYLLLIAALVIKGGLYSKLKDKRLFNLFLPFFLWSFLMMFRSPEFFTSFQKTLSYSLLYLTVPSMVFAALMLDRLRTIRTLVLSLAIFLAIGLGLYLAGSELVLLTGRFKGLMGNPNGLGVFTFLLIILFHTITLRHKEALHPRLKALIWLMLFATLLLCQSRSALFGTMLYFLFASFNVLKGFLGLLTFVSLIISYQAIFSNLPAIIQALSLEEFLRLDTLEEGSGRYIAWEFAWDEIQNVFFTGKGFTYTEWLFAQNYPELSRMGHLGNAHNSFLTFWLDTGLIGLLLFLSGFFLLFFSTSKQFSNAIPVMYALIFSASFESWLTASLNPNTITVLMTLSIMLFSDADEMSMKSTDDDKVLGHV